MAQPPIARLACVCDFVLELANYQHPATPSFQLTNILTKAIVPEKDHEGTPRRSFDLFYQISDGMGVCNLGVSMERVTDPFNNRGAYIIGRNSHAQQVSFDNPLEVHSGFIRLSNMPILGTGEYRFTLLGDGQPIDGGGVSILVEHGDES